MIQKELIRQAYGLPRYTACAGLYITSGIQQIELVITKSRMNYLSYIRNLDDERWVKKALNVQLEWAVKDNILNKNWEILKETKLCNPSYWLKQTVCLAQRSGIPLNLKLTKKDMKLIIQGVNDRRIQTMKNKCSSLQWCDNLIGSEDTKYNALTQKDWNRLRLGGIYLAHRTDIEEEKKCPLCKTTKETTLHFLLQCPNNKVRPPDASWDSDENVQWILSVDRSEMERTYLSTFIQNRKAYRNRLLQECLAREG